MRNYGFKYEIVTPEDYVFGSSPLKSKIVNPSGDWTEFLPKDEVQNVNNVEPYACVSFTTLNAIETLIRYQFKRRENYSDRFLAKISDTQVGGNSPQKVAEFLRKVGAVKEEAWDFGIDINTFDKYYAPIPPKLFDLAREFPYEFKHEYVASSEAKILEALKTSPLGVSVSAWYEKDGMFYRPEGMPNNHFTTLVQAVLGEYWLVFDSYDKHLKRIPWNTRFDVVKRFYLSEKSTGHTQSFWGKIRTYICNLLK